MNIMNPLKHWADGLKNNLRALYLASRNPDVPWLPKIITGLVIAYALSPIDLIPDFIPVLGYLDDLLLLPLGIWLAVKLIPGAVWLECQTKAREQAVELPVNRLAAGLILLLWFFALLFIARLL